MNLPNGVVVGQTTLNEQGVLDASDEAFAGFNFALHVGDDPMRVQRHRIALLKQLGVQKLTWLNQTHSTTCHTVNHQVTFDALTGDGLVTQQKSHALMIMTADCLPVVIGNAEGTEVANLHAGWRGLAGGMIEETLKCMQTQASWAWLGACISQACFEVGVEVKEAFCEKYDVADAFAQQPNGKCHADLYHIARFILAQHGITQVYGGEACTYQQDYFSYRRTAKTGRMATFVFMR